MKANIIAGIIVVLSLLQTTFTKPVEEDEISSFEEELRNNPSPRKQLQIYVYDNLRSLIKDYAASSVHNSRNILKDDALLGNENPEVLEFKNDLTKYVDSYESSKKDVVKLYSLIGLYLKTTEDYLQMPEEKMSSESKLILELLNKYECENLNMEFIKKFDVFVNSFINKFEDAEEYMSKELLQWFEEFKLRPKLDKFNSFIVFIMIA
ncbi:hypothetical protein FF38_12679 [Lucilia cuprina]|uniref:Protein G12 n=1 Tax=Lucilia cuprina TaxID=7375 RepID=A0A0L0C6R4_LUCCU|nr:uncharacterized protein LOC111685853 [Lucilia cuprina]KAI8121034.1 hypothetical protein CVS40_7845 [Lucilia cuprina]KNC27129.1 hypothetical protein FF38_12679 [Lucilia cuprina]